MDLKKQKLIKRLDENNYKLANLLDCMGIKKLNLIGCGNSIASGYSMSSFTKPLLLRNENIDKIISDKGIELKRYNFSRTEDNNDEHVFGWLINDIPLSIINKLNRFDIVAMNEIGVDEKRADEYYPLDDKNTLKQILSDNNSSNIIIYNGATGSFLDNITRNGKHYFTYGIKRDCTSIESFLKYIQEMNREQNKSIQVYLCGAPKLLGLSDTFINPKLKKISKKYSNVSYVENISKKLLYKTEDGRTIVDLHYNENEYLELNDKIINAINDNYAINKLFITIDSKLYLLNREYQLGNITKGELKSGVESLDVFDLYSKLNISIDHIRLSKVLKQLKNYLLERYQHDFYYVERENIKKLKIDSIRNKI